MRGARYATTGMVVGVERRVAGETRERARAGDEAAEQREIVGDAELGGAARHRHAAQPLAHLCDIEALPVAARDESEHGRLQAVGGEHRPAARIHRDGRLRTMLRRVSRSS